MVLFKEPDIPDDIADTIPHSFNVKTLSLSDKTREGFESDLTCFLCRWTFFLQNKDLFIEENTPDESIIVIYTPEQSDDIENHRLIYQFVRIDRKEILYRTFRNMHKIFIRNADYKKEKDLNRELLSIGIALSAERDNDKLLDDILYKIRRITKADAGSLYLKEKRNGTDDQSLLFKIAHNDSNPSDFSELRMSLNTQSIAGYVAVTSNVLNIPDAYSISSSEPYSFNKSYDLATDYRTRSMLTVPMLDHHENTIGVIQLINKKKQAQKKLEKPEDFNDNIEPFDSEDEYIVLALASQAAVSLENNILYNEIEALFEGLVAASVKAIESRDPTTSGHSSRVAAYSLNMAKAVNLLKEGPYKDVEFSLDNLKELRYACLLHDFGKVGVREAVLVKADKLYPGQLELIKMRFAYIRNTLEINRIQNRDVEIYEKEIQELDSAYRLILEANRPSINSQEHTDRLKYFNSKIYRDPDGNLSKWLTDEEYDYLCVKKGCLTCTERKEIESHVRHSSDFLGSIPWTGTLKNLPEIARGHHERLDGTGYPDGISGDEICLQSRIMAVADIYDALAANDRPYKKALSPREAIKILKEETEKGHLDKDVVDIFIENKIYKTGEA